MGVSWRTEWPMWLLLGAQFLLAAVSWPEAPERVPTHWALDGRADGYGSRFQGLLLLPLVSLGLYLTLLFAPQVDPRRDTFAAFAGSYTVLRFATLAVMTAMYGMVQVSLRGYPAPVARVAPLAIGALFLIIGSQMARARPHAALEAFAPWMLSGRDSWSRTNRLAGRLLVAAGVVLLVAGALGSAPLMVATVAGTVVGAVWLVYASYRSYRGWAGDPKRERADPV